VRWAALFCRALPPWCFCFAMCLKAMEPTVHRLKALKWWAKITISFWKLFLSALCHSDTKSASPSLRYKLHAIRCTASFEVYGLMKFYKNLHSCNHSHYISITIKCHLLVPCSQSAYIHLPRQDWNIDNSHCFPNFFGKYNILYLI
jgi:hypothetical protein